jgi:hypothetical protein
MGVSFKLLAQCGLLRVGKKVKDYRSSQKTKKKGSRPSKTAMKATVDRWSVEPDEYQLTAKMRKARQERSDLNPEQRAWSNEVHTYDEVKRVYMPCENPPRIARDSTGGKIKERVPTYAGRVDDQHEYALLNFVRRANFLQHCKPLTTLQSKTVHKYRVKDVTELARSVRIGAQEMRRYTWEFRTLPKSPEGDRTRWERTNTSESDGQNSDSNPD